MLRLMVRLNRAQFGMGLGAVLNSRSQFVLTALALLTHNLGVIGGVLLARAAPGLGIYFV